MRKIYCNRVYDFRVLRNMTVDQLSLDSHVDRMTIVAVEERNLPVFITEALRLADALSVDLDELFYMKEVDY